MIRPSWLRVAPYSLIWTSCVRGDIYEPRAPRGARGHEHGDARFAVVVQSDDLMLSTLLVAPTSRSARARIYRPAIVVDGEVTQVLVEQTAAVATERLGKMRGSVTRAELQDINEALRLTFELD